MPLRTEFVAFDDAREELTEEMKDIAKRQASVQDDNPQRAQQLLERGNELENQREALGHVENEWNRDGVELAGLTTGDINRAQDLVDKHDAVRERDAWVAVGTYDAPYLEHDPTEDNLPISAYEETVIKVGDLPLPYVQWAEGKIADLSYLGADTGNGYLALVREERAKT